MIERGRFLVLHGWQNERPERHWQSWLDRELRGAGYEVAYPQLPEPYFPRPEAWAAAIAEIIKDRPDSWTVICHSLACVAWLHVACRPITPVRHLLFVAPPSIAFLARTPELRDFVPPAESFSRVRSSVLNQPRLVCSNQDPYCDPPAPVIYTDCFDLDLIPHGGHLDMAAGVHEWPELRAWCELPSTRIGWRAAASTLT